MSLRPPDAPNCLCLPAPTRSVERTERRASPAHKRPVCGDRRPYYSILPASTSTPPPALRPASRGSLESNMTRHTRPAVESLPKDGLPGVVVLVISPAAKVPSEETRSLWSQHFWLRIVTSDPSPFIGGVAVVAKVLRSARQQAAVWAAVCRRPQRGSRSNCLAKAS